MKRLWQAPPGYYWKVVVDPTRDGDAPGVFYGGHFRWSDIVLPTNSGEKIPCPFPNGTVFENVRTGERVVIRRGKAVQESAHEVYHRDLSSTGSSSNRCGINVRSR